MKSLTVVIKAIAVMTGLVTDVGPNTTTQVRSAPPRPTEPSMDDLNSHLTDVYVEWFMEHLELMLFVPPPGAVVEMPLDMTEIMERDAPTYGGKPMEPLLPSRDEYAFILGLAAGRESMPGHEPDLALV